MAVIRLGSRPWPVPRMVLLGTGVVGSAFVARHGRLRTRVEHVPELVWLANSRSVQLCGTGPEQALQMARNAVAPLGQASVWGQADELRAGDILVDATASEAVAEQHALWLARGIHVVTANKLGCGGPLARAQAIVQAQHHSGARYGDSATVGAGLPLLRSVRALVAGGDHIHRVEGVLSGSLAWLFHHYDGMRAFSGFVRQARDAGYTEPDPRLDLSGEDVRRKLLILARAAGQALQAEQVRVESLVPSALAVLSLADLDAALGQLDMSLAERYRQAYRNGERLRFLGHFDAQGAQVGVRALPLDHPLCGGGGTDNRVAIFSDRYPQQPLVVQGPGAGAEVTAAALLDDVLALTGAG